MNKYEKAVKIKKEIADLRLPIENMHRGINFNQTIGESFLQSAFVRICYLLDDVIDLIDCDQKSNETKEA